MFAKLSGLVDEVRTRHVIVDVNGVGYLVACSSRTLSQLKTGQSVKLYLETQVREDAITLFGFLNAVEQDCFDLLTSVQGVGGKAALAILSVLSPDHLFEAIISQDKKQITQADGVGAKLAERICNELKSKVGSYDLGGTPSTGAPHTIDTLPQSASDALSALVNLGYNRADALRVIRRQLAQDDTLALSQLIQQSLKDLAA